VHAAPVHEQGGLLLHLASSKRLSQETAKSGLTMHPGFDVHPGTVSHWCASAPKQVATPAQRWSELPQFRHATSTSAPSRCRDRITLKA
jgi:hypothetical protein